STASTNFPLANALQATPGGGDDAFVTKLSPTGNALAFSTYLGGSDDDAGNGIGVHPTDATVYVAGSTRSSDFPTASAIQPQLAGGLDAFVAKLLATGGSLLYSTYLGGANDDVAQALAVDSAGVVFLTGSTSSPAFPTLAPIQNASGQMDAFVTQIADGGVIQFSSSSYSVAENGASIVITVQRTGHGGVSDRRRHRHGRRRLPGGIGDPDLRPRSIGDDVHRDRAGRSGRRRR